ncbi:MAG TPA: metallophosphoesterase [Actinomycetes bacterium]|nr:metallophosphoesterase [Actinomycetes bacterium]
MRLYFCSDIHASRRCWKKFLNSWKFYDADHIVVGGDITGKFVVPIVEAGGGRWTANFMGIERKVSTPEQLGALRTNIADAGQYDFLTTPDELATYQGDQARIDALFKRLVIERAEQWMAEADEKLRGTGVRCFVSGANDDFFEVDDVIARSEVVEDPNGTVIELEGGFELMGMGYGNPTPWACPRDIPERELADRIDKTAAHVRDMSRAILSLHVPPLGSGLDVAPKLDDYLRPRVGAAGLEMIPVGSTATRDAIVKYKPMIGLHGHIHESKGIRKLEGTTIANPGSEYGEGVLDGLLVDIDPKKGLRRVDLVTG